MHTSFVSKVKSLPEMHKPSFEVVSVDGGGPMPITSDILNYLAK